MRLSRHSDDTDTWKLPVKLLLWPIYKDVVYSVSSQKIQWGWASEIWQLDSLFDTVRIVCGAGSIKRSGVRPSVSQSVPSVERSSGVRRVCCWAPYAQKISIDSAGRPAAAAPQPGAAALSSKCGQCHVDSRINEDEHRLVLLSILGLLKFLAVFTARVNFVSGWQHAWSYISTHRVDWTWMDRRTKISRISSWKIWRP